MSYALNQLVLALGEDAVDVNDETISYPCGFRRAIEVDVDPEPDDEDKTYAIWLRTWSADHGLNSEVELGLAGSAVEVCQIVAKTVRELEDE